MFFDSKHWLAGALLALSGTAQAADPALATAPADGWAAMAGGTVGGAAAPASRIYSVSTRAQLLAALSEAGALSKIVRIVGTIDLSGGVPFTSTADQRARGLVKVPSNTTLIGAGPGAGLVNGGLQLAGVTQVIVRNLKIVAPCDVAPVWDPTDGSSGNWNAAFDAISVAGSDHVWIDRNTFTDVPVTDDTLPIENGKKKQCHDGLVDITNASDYVTVSYNVFGQHDKGMLIGGSDSATTDAGRLRVTFSNNVFTDVVQRSPRVRYGQVHLFNNYFAGSKTAVPYAHSYSVGIGRAGRVKSDANVFAITGATTCDQVVQTLSANADSGFIDKGSLLNGVALGGCSAPVGAAWTPPYAFTVRPAALVKANALAQAGAGKLTSSLTGSGTIALPPGTLVPAKGGSAVPVDSLLALAFDSAPTIGSSGKVTVRRVSDNAVVDVLDISTAPSATDTQTVIPRTNLEIDALGLGAMPDSAARARFVWYRPITVTGNVATIRLRSNKLAFDTAYRVSVDASVLTGTIGGAAFAGISDADGWQFTTRSAPASRTAVSVGVDGSGADFRTVQGALNWVMVHCSTGSSSSFGCNTVATPKTISIGTGVYPEMAVVRNVANLNLVGASRDGTVVGARNFESLNSGSGATSTSAGTALTSGGRVPGHRVLGGGRSALLIENCDLLTMRNFTLTNPHDRSSSFDNQSEAFYFNTSTTSAAHRLVVREMNLLSQQDTVQVKGYAWIYNSLVEGNVDYIWGNAMAVLIENSELRTVFDPSSNSPGYIFQARATVGDKGFIVFNSRLTAGPGVTQVYLARSGATAGTTFADMVSYVNTRMGSHVLPIGWCVGTGTGRVARATGATCSSNPPSYSGAADGASTATLGWRESGSMDLDGNPLSLAGRLTSLPVTLTAGGTATMTLAVQLPAGAVDAAAFRTATFVNSTIGGSWTPSP